MADPKLPDNMMEMLWIGTLGKLLVRKGVLTRDEIIAEMLDARQVFAGSDQTADAQLMCAEIDNAVRAIERW